MARIPKGLEPIVTIDGVDRYRPSMQEIRSLSWAMGSAAMRSSFRIEQLVAVTRGGLVPSDGVSRATGIKDIQTFAIEHYQAEPGPGGEPVETGKIKIHRRPKLNHKGEGALFVEDVLDTGSSAEQIHEDYPLAAIAVVYTKHDHSSTLSWVDFYGRYVGKIWVDFPWEVEEQLWQPNHPVPPDTSLRP